MIRRLRRRMTILVVTVLILVTAGIIVSIHYMNWRSIVIQAESALETLSSNSGIRPQLKRTEEPQPSKDGDRPQPPGDKNGPGSADEGAEGGPEGRHGSPGQPPDAEDALASLSNYYVVTLASDGAVKGWTSDRADLYTDGQVADIAALVLSSGKESGRIGTQFYRLTSQNGTRMIIVLDQRLELRSLMGVLRVTVLIASAACLLLCIAAVFLIRAMVRPVQEAFDRQRQFVWDASHELKTPLAVIGANAQVLQGEIGENEYLNYIRSEVDRTDHLVQDLLTLARMDQGKREVKLKQVDLSQAVLSVALPFESTAFEEGKQFEIAVPEGIVCRADEAMIQQLTVILLGNALKYSDAGGRIRVELTEKGRQRELKISNTGYGIAPRDLEYIFDRFYRADASHSREVEGSGLGLSIAQRIVEAHRGKIRVTSELNQETVFQVLLPA